MGVGHLTERIASWVAGVKYSDIPGRVREKAKLQVLSVLGSLYPGGESEAGRKVLEAVRGWRQEGPCTLIPPGDRISLHGALFANAAFSMAYDFDDYLFMGHTGHSAVLAPLALGEARDRVSGEELLTAQVIANEVGGRLGGSVLVGPHNGQAWSYIHVLEGACAASRLLGLDAEKTADAISVALYQPPFPLFPGFFAGETKVLTGSQPLLQGVMAAELAARGLRGSREILDHPRGFFRHFAYLPLPQLFGGLGKSWVTDTLAYKKYPGCAYIDTTVDALLQIREDYREKHGRPLEPGDIQRVEVGASRMTTAMDHLSRTFGVGRGDMTPILINFSIPLSAAITLLAGELTPRQLDGAYLEGEGERIRALAERVHLRHMPRLTLEVVDALDRGGVGILSSVRARDLLRASRQMRGGGAGVTLDSSDLPLLLPLVLRRITRGKHPLDMEKVQFERVTLPFPAEVTVRLKDGQALRARQDIPLGGPGRPPEETRATVENKFRQEASRHLPPERVEEALRRIQSLEKMGSARELPPLLCAGRGN
ncbi:MAG: MmgE/PrpD family protein [Euryarchaeota archaeon]|nr:MmgE/PrpD family protein [Euryarchaeota archaeon]